ncbi:hypothetical protein Ddye_030752 [Dipteronia dyeriana]|uniref:WIT1/2 N-terminal helical bundle domain-containing protein n=1 Tax=Dipteronia dyeriana TaxID=168575 RepID=A0AAD9TGZ7_9ROSI|nr:hypothetical protein Ddye_030752 [Dipteronia dyeriana]
MEANDQKVVDVNTANPTPAKVYLQEEILCSGKDMQDVEDTMRVLTTVDLDLAHSAEKLVNLHVVLMHLLARDNDLETMAVENGYTSSISTEKALVYDLLSGFLDSELREVDIFLDSLQAEIVDAHHKISSCRHLREQFSVMEEKLHDSKESLKQSQEHVLELKTQSVKLPRAFSSFKPENCKLDEAIELTGNVPSSKISGMSKNQNGQRQRHILRMLEKSLARELDLEKKISELKQNEEQLKLKLHHTEQVAFRMEEAAEVVWGRFLEADNASEVLMGISKEMLGRLQIAQFNMNGSLQREAELKSKVEDFIEEMNTKNIALQKLESSNAEHITIGSEVLILKEKVKLLVERLKESGIRLINANASYEASQDQINEMENFIESLKENIYEAESRAETAESKVTQLTDTNLELSEEINFLKGTNESDTKKVGLLENQLRELEIQLKHAKVSSEASQEQQNMLYSAIWDMETLIEDLKSKVSKAESKTESVEEQCILLSESNFKLDKELKFTRDRMQILEYSIDQANKAKVASAKEIDHRAKFMMDMVTQLATQRDHIQKQLYTLTKENKLLVGKVLYPDKNASATMHDIGDGDNKELESSKNDSIHATHTKASYDVVSLAKSSEVDEFSIESTACETELGPAITANKSNGTVSDHGEVVRLREAGNLNLKCVSMAILVALLSVSAIYIIKQENLSSLIKLF